MITYFPIAIALQVACIPILFIFENFNHLPDHQYRCVKSFTCYNFLFQASDDKIAMEQNLVGEEDIKVDSEEFCDANEDQANYDGMRWIIIYSTIVLLMHRCYWCFYNLFHDYIHFSIKYRSLYATVFDAFSRRRIAIRQ